MLKEILITPLIAGVIFFIITGIKIGIEKKKKTAKRKNRKKKRTHEFSKFIIAFYAISCIAWIQQDYILAFITRQPVNTQVTVTLTTTLVVSILGYYAKSAFEKSNRNKYSLDQNGMPFESAETGCINYTDETGQTNERNNDEHI